MEWFTSTNDLYERDDGIPRGTMVFLEDGKKNEFSVYIVFVLFRFILLYNVGSVKCVLDYFRVLLYRL
jgi:hypothetical protein